jgi:hypothetical protein
LIRLIHAMSHRSTGISHLSMSNAGGPAVLYYPFHLCHPRTLERLLEHHAAVHFRDFMALQLTAMAGMTAYADRMGDQHPELVKSGRIVQGYAVSGPLDTEMSAAVDRDLADEIWRALFHAALTDDRRFQRGLFEFSHGIVVGGRRVPGPRAFLELIQQHRKVEPYTIEAIRGLSRMGGDLEDAYRYEYGLALVNTSASLHHTVRLTGRFDLAAVTDSRPHFELLDRIQARDRLSVKHSWIAREGY